MRKTIVVNSIILAVMLCSTVLTFATPSTKRLELSPLHADKSNGGFVISIQQQGEWQEVGRLSFDRFFREISIDLGVNAATEGSQRIRIVQKGGGAAHIDRVCWAVLRR